LFAHEKYFSSSWCFIQALEAKVLVLNVRRKNHTTPGLIKRMENPTELNNVLLLGSVSNLKRIRSEHVLILPFAFTEANQCNIIRAFHTTITANRACHDIAPTANH
jgi:hypothetical protein